MLHCTELLSQKNPPNLAYLYTQMPLLCSQQTAPQTFQSFKHHWVPNDTSIAWFVLFLMEFDECSVRNGWDRQHNFALTVFFNRKHFSDRKY